MTSLHPPLRPHQVLLFTPSGWIRGAFQVPDVQGFLSFINHQEELFKLTEAVLPGSPQVQPFLGLHKFAILLIVPVGGADPPRPEPSAVTRELRLVTCLLSLGSIRGQLELPAALRTSDFLLRKPGFVALHQCHLGPTPYLNPQEALGEALPLVFVNAEALVGITEEMPALAATPNQGAKALSTRKPVNGA